MKKVTDFLRPNILIVFGALLLLYYLNFLSYKGAGLAVGIVGVVLSAYYLAIGIVGLLAGDKLSPMIKKVFDVISVCLFAVFMFVVVLLQTIEAAKVENWMGPTAWTIAILSMIAFLALAVVYPIAKFMQKPVMLRFAYLFSAIFTLALLLAVLFNSRGDSIVLGDFDVLLVAIYSIFTIYLFGSLGQPEAAPAPAKQEEPAPAPAEEPAKEEAPAEQAE